MVILFGVIEFAFVLNASLSVEFATRDAALAAAEAGTTPGADCSILKVVEASIGAPADKARIQEVQIYRSDASGRVNESQFLRTNWCHCRRSERDYMSDG